MASRLRLPHNPNSKASQQYKKRHNIESDDKGKNKKFNKKRKKFQKKNKNELPVTREEAEAPKSFIIIRGRVTKFCKFLRDDLRLIFSPYTAAKLREKQSNSLKDFVISSKEFGVTHLITLSQSDIAGTMLRMIRLPKGPTFWFRIKEYSLIQDIIKMQFKGYNKINNKKWNTMKYNKSHSFLPQHIQFALRFAPLVILNGFSSKNAKSANKNNNNTDDMKEGGGAINNRTTVYHKQLMSVMFKHMFSPMNVINMKLSNCKRVVFFNYDNNNDEIEMRHYKIQIATDLKGISKGIKKIIKQKKDGYHGGNNNNNKNKRGNDDGMDDDKYPDLSKYDDMKDYIDQNKDEYLSESEIDDDENTKVIINKIKKENKGIIGNNASFVRLKEIGPRINMELVKIEELVNDGKVLYHRYVSKTEKEIKELQERKDKENKLKEERRIKQELNIKKKMDLKKEKANKRIEVRKQREVEKLLKSFEINEDDDDEEEEDDDIKQNEKKKKIGKESRKRGILKNKKGNDAPLKKKRKLNQKRVRF